ncbi:casein kinase i isoform delta-like protein [Hordeum vulgare]|nr:casein kinase i isoform delta-like protein [Hordeum vulgare]
MHADSQIWEEHLTIEATIDASCEADAMRLATLNDNSWCFLKGYARAFDKDYELFSQRNHAFLSSRVDSLAHVGPAVRGLDSLFDPFCVWGNEVFMNINQIKKLRKIVKIKKLAMKNNKMFVCTMKKTLVNYRMSFSKQFIDEYVSNHLYGQEARKVFIQHPQHNLEVFLERMKDGWATIHMHLSKVARTFDISEGSIFAFGFNSFLDEIHLFIYRL